MNEETALVPYVPADDRQRSLSWAALAPDVRRRRAMEAAAAHDAGALVDLTWACTLIKGKQRQITSLQTLKSYEQSIHALLRAWTEENLLHPSPDAGDRYVSGLSAELAPGTVAVRLNGAKALYRALRWARATEANPFDDVHAPRNRTAVWDQRQAYPQEDVDRLLALADQQERLFILLCAHAALRVSEALALLWSDVANDCRTLRVQHGKGDKQRVVRCSSTLREALSVARTTNAAGPVIPSAWGRAYADSKTARYHLRRLCERAGVRYLGIHSLRHSAATRLVAQTGNIHMVAQHLGHSDVNASIVYAKMADHALSDQLESW